MADAADLYGRQTVEQAVERYRRLGDSYATTTCFVCSHSTWCHYEGEAGSGCVALSPPVPTLDAMLSNIPTAPMVEGGHGCLCPGYIRGRLPRALTKHLTGLTDEDDGIVCTTCGHGMDEHDEWYGCWSCPCDQGREHPGE